MKENRTEKPTKRKLQKAKERGEVAKSSFLAGVLVFVGAFVLIWGMSCLLGTRFQASMRAGIAALKEPVIEGAFRRIAGPLVYPVIGALFGFLAIAIAAHLLQTGWIWSIEPIRLKWRKKKGERRVVFPLLQFAAIMGVGYFAIREKFDPNFLFASSKTQAAFLFKKIRVLSIEIGVLLLILGLCDFFYQKWRFYKQMHMTSEEKKKEMRESEGDPHTKTRMRHRE